MLSVTRFPQMCRRLFTLKKGLSQVNITHLPAYIRIQTCVYHSSTTGISTQKIIDQINQACKFKDRKSLLKVLKRNNETKLEKPLILSEKMEAFLKPFLFENPMGEIGITLLKFLLKHGEKNSELERRVLEKILKGMDEYNALGLAAIIDCVHHANTDLRWAVVTEYEKQLRKGLREEDRDKILQSFQKYSATALFPYLLQISFELKFKPKYLATYYPEQLSNALIIIGQQNVTHYSLCQQLQTDLAKISYERFRFTIEEIQHLLFLYFKFQNNSLSYLKMLSKHLKSSLDVMVHSNVESDQKTYSHLVSSLITYAILGYYDEEVLDRLVMKIRDIENPYTIMKCYSALSMLNHPGLGFSKEKMKDILADKHVKKNLNYTWLRALVDEQFLDKDYVKELMSDLGKTLTEMIKNDKLVYSTVSSYFLLKAYSEIDLETPIDVSVDETALRTKIFSKIGTQSSLKETLKFVLTEMFGDESLLRCSYFNEYGQLIDIEFYLDNEGTIHNPETYDGDLTRFIVLGLDQTDLILSHEHGDISIQLRNPQLTKIRQLTKLDNTKVIQVYWMEWNALKDRPKRKEFLQSEINAILEEKKESSSV